MWVSLQNFRLAKSQFTEAYWPQIGESYIQKLLRNVIKILTFHGNHDNFTRTLCQRTCRNIHMTKGLGELCSWCPSRPITKHYDMRKQVFILVGKCREYAKCLLRTPTEVPHCSSNNLTHNNPLGPNYLIYFTCWQLDPRFSGSDPEELDRFLFKGDKIPQHKTS